MTPADGAEAPDDFATFTDPRAVTQEGSDIFYVPLNPSEGFASGVDPSADIFLGISVVQGRGGVSLHSLTDGSFRLVETLTGNAVAINANTTAGSDSVTISPVGHLKPFTSYTLIVDGAVDQGPIGDESAPGREFQKLTSTFLTGEVREVEAREVAFDDVLMINGAADGAYQFTSIELSPDGQHLYVATLQGEIKRWDIDPSTGAIIKSSLETFTPGGDFVVGGGRRGIVGLAFDPTDPDTIWITDNYPVPLDGRNDNVPDFSGRVSKVTLGAGRLADQCNGADLRHRAAALERRPRHQQHRIPRQPGLRCHVQSDRPGVPSLRRPGLELSHGRAGQRLGPPPRAAAERRDPRDRSDAHAACRRVRRVDRAVASRRVEPPLRRHGQQPQERRHSDHQRRIQRQVPALRRPGRRLGARRRARVERADP